MPTHAKARAFLENFAKRRIPITYQALAKALQILRPHSIHRVTEALERLMEEDAAADRPFIAADDVAAIVAEVASLPRATVSSRSPARSERRSTKSSPAI